MYTAALFTTAKMWKQTKCPSRTQSLGNQSFWSNVSRKE